MIDRIMNTSFYIEINIDFIINSHKIYSIFYKKKRTFSFKKL